MKIQPILRQYGFPFIFICLSIESISAIILWCGDAKGVNLLIAQSAITLIATFTGIFIPLLISKNWDEEKDRRTLKFTLGLLWHELLYDQYIYENFKKNYNLGSVMNFSGPSFVGGIKVINSKIRSLDRWCELLKNKSFYSAQNSGAIKTFKEDELLNIVIAAYESISDLNFEFGQMLGNLEKTVDLINDNSIASFNPTEEINIKTNLTGAMSVSYSKIERIGPKITDALSKLDRALNDLGVKVDYEVLE